MRKLLGLIVSLSAAPACDAGPKLGVAGATCKASADCAADLQCFASTCTAPIAAPASEALKAANQKATMDALAAEMRALQAEQKLLEAQKDELNARLGGITREVERRRLLDEKQALEQQRGPAPLGKRSEEKKR